MREGRRCPKRSRNTREGGDLGTGGGGQGQVSTITFDPSLAKQALGSPRQLEKGDGTGNSFERCS